MTEQLFIVGTLVVGTGGLIFIVGALGDLVRGARRKPPADTYVPYTVRGLRATRED